MGTSVKLVEVPPGYRCPLCPDHADTEFVASRILGAPICEGCAIEISHFIEDDERPDDALLDRLEEISGLTFPEYQKLGFEELVDDFEARLRPENVEAEVAQQRRFTHQTRDEVVEHWRACVREYRERIRALEDRLTGR
jgi:hypothetical protein